MPSIVSHACASLGASRMLSEVKVARRERPPSALTADLLLYVEDAAIAPAVCRTGRGVTVVELGRGGVARTLSDGLVSGLALEEGSRAAATCAELIV